MALLPNRLNSFQNTGLASLGGALREGATDYANISLRRQDEDRQRAQQLADLQDQRAFTVGQQDRQRTFQREDELYKLLVSEGWLRPVDAQNPQAIAKAAQDRQDNIDRQFAEKSIQDLNAGERADQVAASRDEVQRKINALASVLSEPEAEPDRTQVANEAVRMASAGLKPGEVPSPQAIQDQIPSAYAAIQARQNAEWYRRKQDAGVQYQLLNAQLRDLGAESNALSGKFGKVGISALSAPEAAAPAPTAAPPLTQQQIIERIQEALRARQAASPAPAPAPIVPDPPGMAQGGIVRLAQRTPAALASFGQGVGKFVDEVAATSAGTMGGLWNGDWAVPLDTGPVRATTSALAEFFAPQPGDYMSEERAKAANLRRSLDQPLPPLRPLPASPFQFGVGR